LPIAKQGAAFYSPMPDWNSPLHMATFCGAIEQANNPQPLCAATGLTRAIPQPLVGAPPALYGFAPTNTSVGPCHGHSWDVESQVGEGWACLAARVEDYIGNVGISPPIRVCITDGIDPPPDCAEPVAHPPPTCRDGCAGPDDFPPNMPALLAL
jgi:hypothetical protein